MWKKNERNYWGFFPRGAGSGALQGKILQYFAHQIMLKKAIFILNNENFIEHAHYWEYNEYRTF